MNAYGLSQKSTKLGCDLIRTHATNGSLEKALKVFAALHDRSVYAWTAIISAHVQHNQHEQAFILYNQMRIAGIEASSYTFVEVLKASAGMLDVNLGKLLHFEIVEKDFKCEHFIENALVYMYASCGYAEDAWDVFDGLPPQDTISWSYIISGFAQHGQDQRALASFYRMLQLDSTPNMFTLICILQACSELSSLDQGKLVHAYILEERFEADKFIGSTLVSLYTKCGSIEDAWKVFEGLKSKNVVAWSSMILGYADNGHAEKSIQLFMKMESEGIIPNEVAFVCVLKACSKVATLERGRDIHLHIVKLGFNLDVVVGNTLLDMYATCGSLEDARKVFDMLSRRNVVCWSTMIAGYKEHGKDREALQLYKSMGQECVRADAFLFVYVLNACTNLEALAEGRAIHLEIAKVGLASDVFVGSTLVDMYAKCGDLDEANVVFEKLSARDVVSWSALIEGFATHARGEDALHLYHEMLKDGVNPNEVTFLSILKACTTVGDLKEGNLVYTYTVELDMHLGSTIGNTLVDMYAKGGSLEDAHMVFSMLTRQDVVSWNALIAGYADNGHNGEALELAQRLQHEVIVDVDEFTILAILKACSNMSALDQGKLIHDATVKQGLEDDLVISNSLVNMYAKCGLLKDAHMIFDRVCARSLISWNAMIAGCADHGNMSAAKMYFEGMQEDEYPPNEATFVSLLSGCNHGALIEEGYCVLRCMEEEFDLIPTIQHSICMVDILGRAGRVDEAESVVYRMPFEPDCLVWTVLLSACEKHRCWEQGTYVFDQFVQAANSSAGAYVIMSNICLSFET